MVNPRRVLDGAGIEHVPEGLVGGGDRRERGGGEGIVTVVAGGGVGDSDRGRRGGGGGDRGGVGNGSISVHRETGRVRSAGEERSDEWKVVSYVGRRYMRGAKRRAEGMLFCCRFALRRYCRFAPAFPPAFLLPLLRILIVVIRSAPLSVFIVFVGTILIVNVVKGVVLLLLLLFMLLLLL